LNKYRWIFTIRKQNNQQDKDSRFVLKLFKIWIPVALTAMLSLAACSDDIIQEDLTGEEENLSGKVYLRFRLNLNDGGTSGGYSRADEMKTPGTNMENVVNTIDLLVYDAESGKMKGITSIGTEQIKAMTSPGEGIVAPIIAKEGEKIRIYAAVNLTKEKRQQISYTLKAEEVALSSSADDYWDVINSFIPGSNGRQTTLEANKTDGIPMTGTFIVDNTGSDVIEVTSGNATKENPILVTADVSRIVAKMHVLARSTRAYDLSSGEKGVRYVYAKGTVSDPADKPEDPNNEFANWIGWIRLSNVRYIPNATNKSTYLFPKFNAAGKRADLNMDLNDCLNGDRFEEVLWNRKFVFYSGVPLHSMNISSVNHMENAEAYDDDRYEKTYTSDAPDRYTRGMYCLENYFDIPWNTSFFENYGDAIPSVTHLTIAAKLTPRNIVINKNYSTVMAEFIKEFENNPDNFYSKYRLRATDFNEADVAKWNNIYNRYENGTDASGNAKKSFTGTANIFRDEFRLLRLDSESDAACIINWSLMMNELWSGSDSDFQESKYPAATFFVYDMHHEGKTMPADATWKQRYLYLTAGAAIITSDSNIKIKTYSVPHVGGWGYYYTYLDDTGSTVNNKTPYHASQVTRNTYYLIDVENFGDPGGTITRPEYIRVNTMHVGWDYQGKGNITLH